MHTQFRLFSIGVLLKCRKSKKKLDFTGKAKQNGIEIETEVQRKNAIIINSTAKWIFVYLLFLSLVFLSLYRSPWSNRVMYTYIFHLRILYSIPLYHSSIPNFEISPKFNIIKATVFLIISHFVSVFFFFFYSDRHNVIFFLLFVIFKLNSSIVFRLCISKTSLIISKLDLCRRLRFIFSLIQRCDRTYWK